MCTDNTRIKHYRKLQAIKAQIKELEKQAKKEEDWFFEEFKNQEPILNGKKIIVQYDKKTIDSKRLENDFPDIYKKFLYYVPIKYVNTKANI
ncbi:MAG: hypothetical protein IJP08_03345 [Bacteroidaceae bacterium]|nr:hypothetical protein [Bacteroidaceae bacterium]